LAGLPAGTCNVAGAVGDVNFDGNEDDDEEEVVEEEDEGDEMYVTSEAEAVGQDWVDFPTAGVGRHLSEICGEQSLTG